MGREGGGDGRAGSDSGETAGGGEDDRFEEELNADVSSGGAERPTEADLGLSFEHRDDHDVGDPDATDENGDAADPDVTGRALRPIERIRTEVEELSAHGLHRRVPVPPSGDEVARLAATMNRMLARLQTASIRQQEFVADASHELRNPLASIRNTLEVSVAHPTATDWPDVATSVLCETGRIQHIVDDLLLLARLDEATPPPHQPVDLGLLAHTEVGRITGVTIHAHIADGLLVAGRPDELASVLRNLLDNAARHARTTVAVTAAAHNHTVVITIDDDGPGIPPDERPRIFQRFTRLDHSRTRTNGGVGLGLAIVDRITRRHGGTVTIDDSPSSGARFTVTLPAAP